MLIDDVTIKARSGNGGDGAVAFSHIMMTLGPTGATGGKGGSVFVEAVEDLGALRHYRTKKSFAAQDGEKGRSSFRDGRDGEDLVLLVPRGTVVHDLTNNTSHELTNVGERLLVAKGGHGGKGNFHFRSATNTSPKQFQKGTLGSSVVLRFELKLIADVGLVGLPNVGKSSFLNAVTNAKSKVANYQFTTLEPSLGAYYGLIIADIPGLIEGASTGKGLGIKFLQHIERTQVLFHFIDAGTMDPVKDYQVIRAELKAYNPVLAEKQEHVFITKTDTVDESRVKEIVKLLNTKAKIKEVHTLSIYETDLLAKAQKVLNTIKKERGIL